MVAFFRAVGEGAAGDIWLCDPSGGSLRQLTFDTSAIRGLAWTPDGHDLVYASDRMHGSWQLYRIPVFGGSPREVLLGAREINDPAISPAGHRLAYTQTPTMSAIWVASLPAGENPHTRPILRSPSREAFPSWSPDGKRIAFVSAESGADEVWVSDADGNNRAQVTALKGPPISRPRWSPDGKTLLFSSPGMQSGVYTVNADDRLVQPKPMPLGPGVNVRALSWSHDGKSVYGEWRGAIWKFVRNGEPKQLTQQIGAMDPEESADGKYVYYFFRRSIWRVPSDGGSEEEAVSPDQWVSSLQPAAKGIYYMAWERRRRMAIQFYDFQSQKTTDVLRFENAEIARDSTFDVSPDGKYILYPKIDRTQTDLVLVENFR
jgi:Tol biopolymer transport system component